MKGVINSVEGIGRPSRDASSGLDMRVLWDNWFVDSSIPWIDTLICETQKWYVLSF